MRRNAFTLVELLVTISVIAILSGILLGALYTAQDAARAQKTRSTIAKLHTKMMERWESYQTRRVPIKIPTEATPQVAAAMRLTALRQLMAWELPDRFNEIPDASVTSASYPFAWTAKGVNYNETVVVNRPSISMSYGRRIGTGAGTQYSSAECLYLILTTAISDDETGRELFGDSEVGDKDGDGRNEFWDAWQNPIAWVRWPAGFISELQPVDSTSGVHDPIAIHDPFDSRRVHPEAYGMFPLIYSPGGDGDYEINNEPNFAYGRTATGILDPYTASAPPLKIGEWTDQNSDGVNGTIDNIHNHLIGTR